MNRLWHISAPQEADGLPPYSHIIQNEFTDQMHKKLEEEDIAICECKYDANNPESACGESCLNVLTSTECTPGYCPCGEHCNNQKFQKCEFAKTKLFKTEGRGWGLLADEYIKEYNHLWEEGDDRYTVENVPLYDSAEDDPFPVSSSFSTIPLSCETTANYLGGIKLEAATTTESHLTYGVQGDAAESVETESNKETEFSFDTQAATFSQTTNPMISRIRSNSACRNYNFGVGPSSKKRAANGPKQKAKTHGKKYVSSKPVAQLFASKQAREEITKYEELKNKATSNLNAVYDEIRPAIEAHERDSQDNVPTSIAGKWMDATCDKWKADINFSFSIIKNVMFPPKTDDSTGATGSQGEEKEIKLLTN